MVRCHLTRQHPAGQRHGICFLMHCMHAHTLTFLRCLSSLILQNFPLNISLISQKAHSLFDFIFPHLVSQFLLASRIFARPTSPTSLWQNNALKCFPFTYSWNYVHNKDLFCNKLKNKATKKALTPLLFWPVAYRASTPRLCISAVEVLVLQSVCRADLSRLEYLHTDISPDSCTCMDHSSDRSEELKPSHCTHLCHTLVLKPWAIINDRTYQF